MTDDCTFLLSSYDGGSDCWEGFFSALKEQWPQMNMGVVLNTESKSFSFPGYEIRTFSMYKKKKVPWGKRLIETLKRIPTEYIVFFLEDYWLDAPVDHDFFLKTLGWMRENPDIASFSFYPCLPGGNIQDARFERFELRPGQCEYRFNCQVAVWRRERLIEFLRPHEDPWEWEIYGSVRASRYPDRFYVLKEDAERVFSYGDNMTGCIIHKGKWNKEAVLPMQEKYGLNIDFSIRGFEDWEEIRNRKKLNIVERLKMPHLRQRIVARFRRNIHKRLSLK